MIIFLHSYHIIYTKIKIAYIEKLKQNHPEENLEGFKRVRKVYEDALKSVVKV